MSGEIPIDALLKTIFAFVGGGVLNTAVLSWLVLRTIQVDKRLAIIGTRLDYIRDDVSYIMGRERTERNGDRDER